MDARRRQRTPATPAASPKRPTASKRSNQSAQPDVIPDLWFKNAIIYNLDVRSFMDADGNGLGDFRGLSGRLDYLAGLGVTCLWLMPFYPTPDRDDGYDITDYYGVDRRYGDLGELVELTRAAEQRGIRVIADLVVNHTSIDHPWFQEARRDPHSRYRDWYIWSKKRPRDWNRGMVFPGVQKSTWSYDSVARAWYLHRFYEFQPDLNTAHPEVQQEIRRIMGYWLAVGINGFRVDAVPFKIGRAACRERVSIDV
jgi:maltose alpha-D-glucosyltransferase/alpha-amylase